MADLHIGDPHCDERLIRQRIQAIADDPHAYVILNGDIMNVAVKSSPSDVYSERMSPTEQLIYARELFAPIQDRIIAISAGNHEARAMKNDGIDLMRLFAREIGKEDAYGAEGILIFLSFGAMTKNNKDSTGLARMMSYVIYATHGSGGGRKEGAKAIRLADMASIVDADIYLHSHTHLPMIMKQSYGRTNRSTKTVTLTDRLFVNTAATLDYGGYGQALEFKPSSKDSPVVHLCGTRFMASATL